ncbi:MAG: DUF4230 domain-containing protein [Patescibacteria group bacterium]|nr:DUF4230 domain-containing protein [Patescibacteria group bacterium]
MKKYLLLIIPAILLVFALLGTGYWVGLKTNAPKSALRTEISSQSILTALHDRGFLVTQTYFFDQPVVITKTTGSAFKDLFFGQTITARGLMEINLGTDLAKITQDDVVVGEEEITVTIPKATLFNSRLVGPLEVKNEKGLLKRITDSDSGYNEALQILNQEAEKNALGAELLGRADERAKEDTARLLGFVAEGKKITIKTSDR